jgi:hypothetical protein
MERSGSAQVATSPAAMGIYASFTVLEQKPAACRRPVDVCEGAGALAPGKVALRRPGSKTSDRHFAARSDLRDVQKRSWFCFLQDRHRKFFHLGVSMMPAFETRVVTAGPDSRRRHDVVMPRNQAPLGTNDNSTGDEALDEIGVEVSPALAPTAEAHGAGLRALSRPPMIKIIKGAEVDGPGVGAGRRHGRFAYHAPRYPLVCGFSRQPLLDACRQLQSLYGVTAERVGLFREGRSDPDISCMVEAGAATTVEERDSGGIRFAKYKSFSRRSAPKQARSPVLAQDSQNPDLSSIEVKKPLQNGGSQ